MTCARADSVQLFVDDELPLATHDEMVAHLAGCVECTAAVAEHLALKKIVSGAANRYSAPPELHAALYRQTHHEPRARRWTWGLALASLALVCVAGFSLWRTGAATDHLVGELVDQHVVALSSVNPVDVISEDRHTVKPWFQGKLPFAFNLPELAGTNVTLIGGKLVYLQQRPAAELLYQAGRHKLSVFVLQEESARMWSTRSATFNVKQWAGRGLRFVLVTDASDAEASKLVAMFEEANRP
jgi:anti-sigma factor RsiW